MKKLIIIPIVFLLFINIVYAIPDALNPAVWAEKMDEGITSVYKVIQDFVELIQFIMTTTMFYLYFLLYILLITLIFWIPIQIYPIYKKNRELIRKIIKLT